MRVSVDPPIFLIDMVLFGALHVDFEEDFRLRRYSSTDSAQSCVFHKIDVILSTKKNFYLFPLHVYRSPFSILDIG